MRYYGNMSLKKLVRQTVDNWQNVLLGLGTSRDKSIATTFLPRPPLDSETLCYMYHQDDVCGRIVDIRPEEMMRKGFEVCGLESEQTLRLISKLKTLEGVGKVLESLVWGRLYGGCLLIMGIDDGMPQEMPVSEPNVKTVYFLQVIDRRYVTPERYYQSPLHPKFGEVEVYRVTPPDIRTGAASILIHESRCIRFGGARTDKRIRIEQASWDYSVLQRPYDACIQFANTFASVGHLVSDASQAVFKMSGLVEAIASGEKERVQERMALVDMNRSVSRAILLDKESGEEYERKATSFAGLPDTLDRFMLRLASAARMPATILMGQSPAGLSATGDSDFRWFYDSIHTDRVNDLEPKLLRLLRVLCLAKDGPTKGQDPVNLSVKWPDLWQMTAKEQAEVEKLTADRDTVYITNQVLLPEEVALSRFGKGKWSSETSINVEARQTLLENEAAFMRTKPGGSDE